MILVVHSCAAIPHSEFYSSEGATQSYPEPSILNGSPVFVGWSHLIAAALLIHGLRRRGSQSYGDWICTLHFPETGFNAPSSRVTRTPNREWKSSESKSRPTNFTHNKIKSLLLWKALFKDSTWSNLSQLLSSFYQNVQNDPSAGQCSLETPRHTCLFFWYCKKMDRRRGDQLYHGISSKEPFFNFLRQVRIHLPNFCRVCDNVWKHDADQTLSK